MKILEWLDTWGLALIILIIMFIIVVLLNHFGFFPHSTLSNNEDFRNCTANLVLW